MGGDKYARLPATWRIHRPTVSDVSEALRIQARFQLSFRDAMMLTSAHRLGGAIRGSADLSHRQIYEEIERRDPFG